MNFDRLAPHYDWMEAILAGQRLQRVRTAWMESLAGRRRILSVGEGHGRFAAACTQRFPSAELTCVEASAAMVARAKRRVGAGKNVRWAVDDFLAWQPPAEKFDAIVTCFFLDCFSPRELEVVVAKLAGLAADDAVWLVADFALPAAGWRRRRAMAIHMLMYTFFRWMVKLPARRLTPPDALLHAQGFGLSGRRDHEWGLLRADRWQRP